MIYGLNADFMNLMMLNGGSAVLLWAGMAVYDMNIGWFWIEPWAGIAVYAMNIGWLWI